MHKLVFLCNPKLKPTWIEGEQIVLLICLLKL